MTPPSLTIGGTPITELRQRIELAESVTLERDGYLEYLDLIEALVNANRALELSTLTLRSLWMGQAEVILNLQTSVKKLREVLNIIVAQDPQDPPNKPTRLGGVCAIAKVALQ